MLAITTETASRTIAEFKRQSLLVETAPNRFLLDVPTCSASPRTERSRRPALRDFNARGPRLNDSPAADAPPGPAQGVV